MRTLRQVNITNCRHYFFNSMTKVKNFVPSLLSVNQIAFENNDEVICDIQYIPMKVFIGQVLFIVSLIM